MIACVFWICALACSSYCAVLISGLARGEVALHQRHRPLQIGFGKRRLGLIVREIGALRRVVELHELVALFHPLAGDEINFAHLPRDLRGHIHLLIGGQRANGGKRLRNARALGNRHLHRSWRRLMRGEICFDRRALEAGETVQSVSNAAYEQQREQDP